MAVFTMIMGNAFAAITVMTVGIGAPFVLQYGADPVVIGSLALTCGYCGTLCTPMAVNFNMVPVAILEMKDKNGVIKKTSACCRNYVSGTNCHDDHDVIGDEML
ncbi:MAG: 5-oxoproline transporter, DUF979 family subunit [Holdemanella porci]